MFFFNGFLKETPALVRPREPLFHPPLSTKPIASDRTRRPPLRPPAPAGSALGSPLPSAASFTTLLQPLPHPLGMSPLSFLGGDRRNPFPARAASPPLPPRLSDSPLPPGPGQGPRGEPGAGGQLPGRLRFLRRFQVSRAGGRGGPPRGAPAMGRAAGRGRRGRGRAGAPRRGGKG